MNAAIQAQINAHKAAPQAPRRSSGTTVRPAGVRAVVGTNQGRDTPKEAPGPKANARMRYAFAGPLHAEQFPGEFRCTITGPLPLLPLLPALVEALEALRKLYLVN